METQTKIKQPHEYWYYFSCIGRPYQIKENSLPNPPYKRFETYEECLRFIEDKKGNK